MPKHIFMDWGRGLRRNKSFRGHPRQVEKQSKVCHLKLIVDENAVNFVNSGFNMAKYQRLVGNLIPRLAGVVRETLS